jgi:hypothetical protein
MRKLTILIILTGLLSFISCDGLFPQNQTPNPFPNDESIPEDLIIRLKRTPCYGTCPAYMLTIKADGKVSFFGQDFTEVKGQAEGEISKEKVKELIAEFKKANFFELDDNYTSKNCATDNPTVRTTLFINSKVKKIEHDLGCEAPKELTDLENNIDEIVGTKKWIGDGEKTKNTDNIEQK